MPSSNEKKKTKLTYAEKLEWDHIDDDLDQLDNKRKSIEKQMTEQSANYQKLAELQKELDQVKKEIDDKTARWEYLSNYID